MKNSPDSLVRRRRCCVGPTLTYPGMLGANLLAAVAKLCATRPTSSFAAPKAMDTSPRRLPLDYLDKLCLAGTSVEHGTSGAPVWQLEVEGDFDEAVARQAMEALVRRYPVLVSRVESDEPGRDWRRCRRLVYAVDEQPDVARLFECVDMSAASEQAFETFSRSIFNRFLHPDVEYPARFTWARTSPTGGVLFLQQHHGIADGKAFFELISDFATFYERAAAGALLTDVEPVGKIAEDEVAEARRWARWWYRIVGLALHLVALARATLRPADSLACNIGRDYTGHNDVVHLTLDDDLLGPLRALRQERGLSPNDAISGALSAALARWSAAEGAPVRRFNFLVVADARPRGSQVRSFANHLSSFLVWLPVAGRADPVELARKIRRQVRRQAASRTHIKKLISEIFVTRALDVATISKMVYATPRAPLSYSFSNLIPISPRGYTGRFATTSWAAESLRIMTPSPFLQGINTTVIRYAGQLCFNFNYKESVVSRDAVLRLIACFRECLSEMVPLPEPKDTHRALAA